MKGFVLSLFLISIVFVNTAFTNELSNDRVSAEVNFEMPAWLIETGVTPVSDEEAVKIQGEWVPALLIPFLPAIFTAGTYLNSMLYNLVATGQFGKAAALLRMMGLLQ